MVDENFIRNQLGKAADPQIHRMGISMGLVGNEVWLVGIAVGANGHCSGSNGNSPWD